MRYLSLMGFLLLAACGQSGDLYLPSPPPAPLPAPAPASEPVPAETPDEDEK